ncbi:uncharacterized protein F5147DRAFT_777099 [Suillus discolor]|uniref:Uncharacterized protein n=1 Tax=Suillus discolor TaxID=1912936 RepID=A0A9P7JQX6_9AGAM|nr:uncharacterized protein F5147DRAFT_777099 [Suillus discolor]KAG2100192.1 hypothetical protein F5147DRAFT_777099 [Suillus discolor]
MRAVVVIARAALGPEGHCKNSLYKATRTTSPTSELDMGFPPSCEFNFHHSPDLANSSSNFLAVDHPASNSVNVIPPKDSPFDMGFDALLVQHEHPDQMPLDMGFGINPVDYVPDRSVDIELEDRPLDMGFGIHPVHNFPDQSYKSLHYLVALLNVNSVDIGPDNMHLDMGFETPDLVYLLPDQSLGQPEPIGFVIERAVGDLRLATHWLEMQRAHGTMSPEEVSVSREVLQSTNELLLAFQLISIYRLST